jgi:hypothetical protein
MNGRRLTDAEISKALRAHLPDRADPGLRERILDAADTTGQQRALPSFLGALIEADPVVRRRSLLIAAALLIALALASAAAVGALRLLQHDPVQDLSLKPPAEETAPNATPVASAAAASASPSPSALLIWTQASLHEDWPAPVRTEPARPPILVPILPKIGLAAGGSYVDPTGDNGSAVHPWADIAGVTTACRNICVGLRFVAGPMPAVDPSQQWIAYGVVEDTDGDGVPDWRYGVDNVPVAAPGADGLSSRWWRTDLHTGRTESAVGDHVVLPSGTMFYGEGTDLFLGGDVTGSGPAGGGTVGGLPKRFYAWASVIQDGRVVATDYAPDAGWLVPSRSTKP